MRLLTLLPLIHIPSKGWSPPRPTAPVPGPSAYGNDQLSVPSMGAIPRSSPLSQMTPAELKRLGATNKKAFFEALLPAALESERLHGVPAAVTLAQAALESGWAASPIGGFNIFGIKGSGPAGSKVVSTKEYLKGKWVTIQDKFALYRNFHEAIVKHGELFHNGYYKKGISEFAKNRDPWKFIDNIGRVYATAPNYASSIKKLMKDYDLVGLAERAKGNAVANTPFQTVTKWWNGLFS